MGSTFSVSFLDQNEFRIFFLSYKVMELSVTVLVALGLIHSIYECLPDISLFGLTEPDAGLFQTQPQWQIPSGDQV